MNYAKLISNFHWANSCCMSIAERAKELADKVGGQAMTLEEVENFHPEEGMILANTTSVGMKPNVDDTPISKVSVFPIKFLFILYDFMLST